MEELVVVKNNDVFTDSLVIAKGTGDEHESIVRIIFNYKYKFCKFSKLQFTDLKSGNLKGEFNMKREQTKIRLPSKS